MVHIESIGSTFKRWSKNKSFALKQLYVDIYNSTFRQPEGLPINSQSSRSVVLGKCLKILVLLGCVVLETTTAAPMMLRVCQGHTQGCPWDCVCQGLNKPSQPRIFTWELGKITVKQGIPMTYSLLSENITYVTTFIQYSLLIYESLGVKHIASILKASASVPNLTIYPIETSKALL